MSGVQWRRWDPLREFHREVGRILDSFESFGMRAARPFPALNLYDAGDRYILTAELPGVAPKEIDLSITGETLTLKGERKRPGGVSDERFRRQERPFGRWARSVTLPNRVDGSRVAADFALGVLTVTLPKDEDALPRQIAVSGDD